MFHHPCGPNEPINAGRKRPRQSDHGGAHRLPHRVERPSESWSRRVRPARRSILELLRFRPALPHWSLPPRVRESPLGFRPFSVLRRHVQDCGTSRPGLTIEPVAYGVESFYVDAKFASTQGSPSPTIHGLSPGSAAATEEIGRARCRLRSPGGRAGYGRRGRALLPRRKRDSLSDAMRSSRIARRGSPLGR
jgi:hypothetical protein